MQFTTSCHLILNVCYSDLIGRIKLPVKELMARPNQMFRRTDKLMGFEDATEMSGTLQLVHSTIIPHSPSDRFQLVHWLLRQGATKSCSGTPTREPTGETSKDCPRYGDAAW